MDRSLIVAITGATGPIYAVRLLEILRGLEIPTELVMSEWGEKTVRIETPYSPEEVRSLATRTHAIHNQAAPISSGSYPVSGMVIIPCTMHTLACISTGTGHNLIHRAADVTIKERRRLVVVARETPLSQVHLKHMLNLSSLGATIMPPMSAHYLKPQSIDDMVTHFASRVLDQFDIDTESVRRWGQRR